ncbi:MAG: hypothetical protein P8124_01650 [Gammaproteobacteria bacterium]
MPSLQIIFNAEASRVLVDESRPLAEHEQIWVWDVFYASMLHVLSGQGQADELREHLDSWAVQMASKVYIPADKVQEAGLTRIRQDLELVSDPEAIAPAGMFALQVTASESGWPDVKITGSDDGTAAQTAAAVVALAQHFLDTNPLFIRELPIHLLSLRKFYTDVMAPGDERSVQEAPVYALSKALEYYQDAGKAIGRSLN